ncbi:alpha-L-rhamnosidase [Lactobacillus colini]|uniref:alpha-L-rhamnosidase n=1 Tax=Lactobacillus colini TaxID=1819254 RepID=A0ABS4MEZ0_9LACO|nr:alpha-L-rhamnosidase [Lactobacillus colini]MBP2058255.1 alpha-L-rhamnosidase [Lactobacillus colini]
MKITNIQINHMTEPVGFNLSDLRVNFSIKDTDEIDLKKQVIITANDEVIYDSGEVEYDNNCFDISANLKPRTRYSVEVKVSGKDSVSSTTFFETGKMNEVWNAKWIANENKDIQNTLFKKDFETTSTIKCARLYITALGLYEAYLNGEKVGNEYLAPGLTAYDKWIQVQTYDVTDLLKAKNEILISTGDGWYKGNIGFNGGQANIYGDQHMAIAEMHIIYEDGHEEVVNTDSSWETTSGRITKSAIYYGEDYDSTIEIKNWRPVVVLDKDTSLLKDRLSLPITIHEILKPVELIHTPKGEQVIDFGQNHAGLIEFYNREPKGTKITLQAGEILQEGNFYRDNLRAARAAFTYVSDGQEGWVRQHFTYYGFRYLKVTGNTKPLSVDDFRAPVLYSDMPETGKIETDNKLVNRLLENVLWGQKSNFIDDPIDCPQRDERLPWTGDANVFSKTAALNMNVFEFFKKYAKDMATEQEDHDGMLTMYAPKMGVDDGGAAVWGDAATFIPWNMYEAYGDAAILKQNYQDMKSWVDWITKQTKVPNLWVGTFQFGDWLALDGEVPGLPTGKTNEDYVASVYYYASTKIVAKTAELLGNEADAKVYGDKAKVILRAIQDEYITKNGRVAIDTQTAYALALQFNLVPEDKKARVADDLAARLHKDNDHLKTGFVGTPFVNQVLSEYGHHKLATKIFMQEDFPSWLYAVKMGATTVWERWNSVQEDGSMNPEGMNSLNHYSIGAIMEWVYRYVLGIRSHSAGYQRIDFAPEFDYRLKHIKGHYQSSYGDFKVEYQIEADEEHTIKLNLSVPYGVVVKVHLPRTDKFNLNGEEVANGIELAAGDYMIEYIPNHDYIERYTEDTPVKVIMSDRELVERIDQVSDVFKMFENDPNGLQGPMGGMSIAKINEINPSINIAAEEFEKIYAILTTTPILEERN